MNQGGGFAVADLRAFLAGRWRIVRAIEDRRTGQRGRLDGLAVWAPDGDGLAYREDGVLRLAGFEGPANRRYRYDFPAPARAEVRFEHGAPFHDLDLTGGAWRAEHRCDPDLYEGQFRAEGPWAWEATWRVAGPRKDFTLVTRYRRAG
jgi:hypothetical protein